MTSVFKFDPKINHVELESYISGIINSDDLMLQVQNKFHQYCYDFIPMGNGEPHHLAEPVEITPEYVKYAGPYAHYQYTGKVYKSNIPIFDVDNNMYFRSPAGKAKIPTDRNLNYNPVYTFDDITYQPHAPFHPKATANWDKAMLAERGDEFKEAVGRMIIKEAEKFDR